MCDVPLEVPLRPLPLGRCGTGSDPNVAGVQQSGHPLDHAALAGGIPTFEQNDHAQAAMSDPLLELDQLHLEAAKLLVILLSRKDGLSLRSLAHLAAAL